jgi:hypothetical protein
MNRSPQPAASTAATTATSPPATPPTPEAPASSSTGSTRVVSLDTELGEARKAAQKLFPDAELSSVSATGIEKTGKVDLSVNTRSIGFFFRSPAESRKSKKCMVTVSVSGYGTFTSPYEDTVYDCKQPVIEKPRCSAARVLGDEAGDAQILSLTLQNQAGAWQWVVMLKGGTLRIRPDNCN